MGHGIGLAQRTYSTMKSYQKSIFSNGWKANSLINPPVQAEVMKEKPVLVFQGKD